MAPYCGNSLIQMNDGGSGGDGTSPPAFSLFSLAPAALLLGLCLAGFAWRAWHGLHFLTFGDETEHFVGAKVLQAGGLLYRDFIDSHGPLIYALPQLYGALFGWVNPLHARILTIVIQLLTCTFVAASPALRGAWERMMAASLFLGLTTSVWLVQALFMVDYQPIAGMLMLIGLAQFTVPAWFGARVGAASMITAGFCFALTWFDAFSYGPAAFVFVLSGVWAWSRHSPLRTLGFFAAGLCAGAACMLVWMAIYGDFRGYVVFHTIFGLKFYGPYLGFGPRLMFKVLQPRLAPWAVVQAMGLIAFLAWLILTLLPQVFAGAEARRPILPTLLGALGIILCNPRGSTIFQNGAFIVVAFGLAALACVRLPRAFRIDAYAPVKMVWAVCALGLIFGAEAMSRLAISTPHGYPRAEMVTSGHGMLIQSDDDWATKLRKATDLDERILAIPFEPDKYLLAGRLPIKGYMAYLPWDADYGRHPVLGVAHDLCADLRRDPPPVIYYNGWIVWRQYDPRRYMPCVLDILATQYRPMPGRAPIFCQDRSDVTPGAVIRVQPALVRRRSESTTGNNRIGNTSNATRNSPGLPAATYRHSMTGRTSMARRKSGCLRGRRYSREAVNSSSTARSVMDVRSIRKSICSGQ